MVIGIYIFKQTVPNLSHGCHPGVILESKRSMVVLRSAAVSGSKMSKLGILDKGLLNQKKSCNQYQKSVGYIKFINT